MVQEETDDPLGLRNMIGAGLRGAEVKLYELIMNKSDKLRQSPEFLRGVQDAYNDLVDSNRNYVAGKMSLIHAQLYLQGVLSFIDRTENLLRKRKISEYLDRIFGILSPRVSVQLSFAKCYAPSRNCLEIVNSLTFFLRLTI